MRIKISVATKAAKYSLGIDRYKGYASFCVMREDGEIMEYGSGIDDVYFKKELDRVIKYYKIPTESIISASCQTSLTKTNY